MKKKVIINLLLLIIFLGLVLGIFYLYNKLVKDEKKEQEVKNQIAEENELSTLSNVAYSTIPKIGYENPKDLLEQFVYCFNEADGTKFAGITDLFAKFIYDDKGKDNFDDEFTKLLKEKSEYNDFVSISSFLQIEEKNMIKEIDDIVVDMSLENIGEVTQVDSSRYLYEVEADIKVIGKDMDGNDVNRIDKILFKLLKLNNIYYIIEYIQI